MREKTEVYRRLRLRRPDGEVYLERWGVAHPRLGGVLVHRMSAPDPGLDLHDHPWWFATLVVRGGYVERRADTATFDEQHIVFHRRWSLRRFGLTECHRISRLLDKPTWTVVVRGRDRRGWGFYVAGEGFVDHDDYALRDARPLTEEHPRSDA